MKTVIVCMVLNYPLFVLNFALWDDSEAQANRLGFIATQTATLLIGWPVMICAAIVVVCRRWAR